MKSQSQDQNLRFLMESMGHKHPSIKKAGHGMTVQDVEDLKSAQSSGDKIDTIPANLDSSFKINEHEQHLVHVYLKDEDFNKKTGKSIRKVERVQKFYVSDFDKMAATSVEKGSKKTPENAFGSYDVVKVIHHPKNKTVIKDEIPEKELTEMTIEELREKYEYVIGGSADETADEASLIQAINAKG